MFEAQKKRLESHYRHCSAENLCSSSLQVEVNKATRSKKSPSLSIDNELAESSESLNRATQTKRKPWYLDYCDACDSVKDCTRQAHQASPIKEDQEQKPVSPMAGGEPPKLKTSATTPRLSCRKFKRNQVAN